MIISTHLEMSHVMEKMYTFSDFPQWISKLCYDNTTRGEAYAIVDGSICIYDVNTRKRIAFLKDIHEATITDCLW